MSETLLFSPVEIGAGITLRNRIAMAPMTTWAGNDDGSVSDAEEAYYKARAKDVGLVITGCSHVQPNGIGFTDEFSSDDDRFIPSLAKLARAAKSGGAPALLQLFHAGVKAPPSLVADPVAASAVEGEAGPFAPAVMPRTLTDIEVEEVVKAFGDATRRAIEAGFDGIELHGAHGFLIQNFFSPYFNQRDDRWGGSLENRMRFPLAVVREVRRVIAAHATRPFVLGYRVSPEESNEGGLRISDTLTLVDRLIPDIDYLHASLGNAVEAKPIGGETGPTIIHVLADRIAGRISLTAAGQIRTPQQAQRALDEGLSFVALGQALVMNPDWVALARDQQVERIAQDVSADDVQRLAIPKKLWGIIESTPGWFNVRKGR